jgi:predicted AlkP superfamily pyrophosphatase or phosphodiesterase
MRKLLSIVILSAIISNAVAQDVPRPKLVVGVVIDQMRWDYLYRYSDRYTETGFKRLIREGFSCENAMIPYMPTYTAPGHSCIYSGSVPSIHGIIGNNWYDRNLGRSVYCTDDSTVTSVGSNSVWGRMSPKNMVTNTITDELRLSNNFRGKTIAVALKDRGAILPGGHTANAAYWFDNTSGTWITSTYYMTQLPAWVIAFNNKKRPDYYLKQNWNTLFPLSTYVQSTSDNKPYENNMLGEGRVFLHKSDTISNNKYESFRYTPYGNTFTMEMAEAAVENEKLGKGKFTDFLAVSFSSTDYIGHSFGPNSIEIEDTYLRLDRDISAFLSYLDKTVGKNNYLFFLTADHGVAHIPGFEKENNIPAGNLDDLQLKRDLNDAVQKSFNIPMAISSVMNYQVYLNTNAIANADKTAIKNFIIRELLKQPGIAKAFDLENVSNTSIPATMKMMITNGYNQKLSGDIEFVFQPQWFDWGGTKGTTHGSWYPYDTHIPLLFFGWNVKPGHLNREVYMTDIAPTLAAKLHIQTPNGTIGKVIEEVVR